MKTMKRTLAMLLVFAMALSLAACGTPTVQNAGQSADTQLNNTDNLSRDDKELIADLIGDQDASDMSDEELDKLVEDLVGEQNQGSSIVNLGTQKDENLPAVDASQNKDVYDENGAMTKPFDQVYPDLIEQEQIAFSGESILIKMTSNKLTDGLKAAGIGALEEIVPMDGYSWYEARLIQGTDAKKALADVRELDEVLLAEYNYEVQTAALDDYKHFDKEQDEDFKKNGHNKDQWHFHYCGIVDGYEEMEKEGGDSSVIVAVIDSGVDYEHEDLKDNMWVNTKEIPDNGRDDDGNGYIDDYYGVDIISGKGNGGDTNGHGTHVAGIIAARNNNVGVMGIAYNVKIMSVKAAMHNGTLNQADIAKAVLYAYENGAEVINMSFGGSACSIAVQDALATAYTRCVLVASAGNNGLPNELTPAQPIALPNYPAALTYVLGVMSVDEAGVESAFTNWDSYAFNGVEYELYAPGENIMSTLPGNKYGYLSGTSMAAPVVSAFAAILRSEFADRDKYPTKFIYGQLAATSEIYADCLNPGVHGPHNLPQVADLNAALTKLPKPELNVQDYALFDDPKFSDKNNGDGVIDAGETIALGLIIQNRWGMSENTMVTIDTISHSSGLSDPYITILNPTVDYGSVGTYSTQDCGKIYTDELLTGWENPFMIKIAEDCPNDYRFTLNIKITCENALDEEDETVYVFGEQPYPITLNENVRSGKILPSIIEEDMVLTKDNLYIIPNATIIQEGVTVRVEPGTHIQFWSDDANDPYADSYIAYLLVNGQFLVEGTKEEPVYIYPSQLMDRYNVEIASSDKGYISLKHADVTNLAICRNNTNFSNRINLADHCTFRNNYGTSIYCRYLDNGVVRSGSYSGIGFAYLVKAKDCVFYKLGLESYQYIYGSFDRCIFSQCGFRFGGGSSLSYGSSYINVNNYFKNCVFLGNELVDQTNPNNHNNSAMQLKSANLPSFTNVYYCEENGHTYIVANGTANGLTEQFLAETLDQESVSNVIIENEAEAEKLARALFGKYSNNASSYSSNVNAGIYYDKETGKYLWSDGSEIISALDPDGLMNTPGKSLRLCIYKIYENGTQVYGCELTTSSGNTMFELPGQVLPTDITFREYAVDMDMEATYQLAPLNTPVQLPADQFLYESTDEAVLTVSDAGLVTPVGKGTADVWVWSLDRAVKNRVTFTVRDYVALEGLTFPAQKATLEMGTSAYAACELSPADTTRRNVVYTSSDPSVVTVENGLLTAVGKGTATITATCEGITATMEISTWVRATTFTYQTYTHRRTVESMDTSLPALSVYPKNADLDLEWTSSDPSILTVEDGKFIAKKSSNSSSVYLYATDRNSGEKATFQFYITATAPQIQKDVIAVQLDAGSVALPEVTMAAGAEAEPVWKILDPAVAVVEDGKIVLKGAGLATLRITDPRSGLTDEIFLYVADGDIPRVKTLKTSDGENYSHYALLEDGRLYSWYTGGYSSTGAKPTLISSGVKAFDPVYNSVILLLEDNTIVGYFSSTYSHTYSELQDVPLKDVTGYYSNGSTPTIYALAEDGTVYAYGDNSYGQLGVGNTTAASAFTKVDISAAVTQVAYDVYTYTAYYLTEGGELYISGTTALQITKPVLIARNVTWLDHGGKYYVTDNHLAYFDGREPVVSAASLAGYTMLDAWYCSNNFNAIAAKGSDIYSVSSNGTVSSSPVLKLNTSVTSGGVARIHTYYGNNAYYAVSEDGMLFVSGTRYYSSYTTNAFLGMSPATSISAGDPLYLPIGISAENLTLVETNLEENNVLTEDTLRLDMNKNLLYAGATVYENGNAMIAHTEFTKNQLHVEPSVGFTDGASYKVVVSVSQIRGVGITDLAEDLLIEFTYQAPKAEEVPEKPSTQPDTPDQVLPDAPETPEAEPVVYEAIVDETIVRYWTLESLQEKLTLWNEETQLNGHFYGNAILNHISTDTNVNHWMRIQAPEVTVGTYSEIPLGGNYWGSTNETAIGLQIIDYADFPNYGRVMYAPYLTQAPENTFPFVTSVKLFNKYGDQVTTVGNEEITFQVKFNRDMDTSIPLLVRFGSAFPYGDYEIPGAYVDARTWEGTYTLKTTIENGNQFFTISNGCSATDDLELQIDQMRFGFEIDTTAAQALIMQGTALDTGIELTWTQDDFETLMGYNVYRSTKEDGQYTRLNKVVIPAETMTFFDDTVEPGKIYYYNFTVVQTDMAESEPSGKIVIMSKDTMAPNIYHSPVANAFTGSNLVLDATITDNLNIAYANLYYRIAGTESWSTIRMNKLNDKYSAIIPAQYITLDGIEYYIEAFDGVSFTYKGGADAPYTIAVQEAIGADALGDVDGDGVITNLDALLLLYTINDKYNMTAAEFARADLNGDGELMAAEALRILQYVSGVVGSVKM